MRCSPRSARDRPGMMTDRPPAPDHAAQGIVVLGVDPGLRITGFGLVRVAGVDASLIDAGVLRAKGDTPARLAQIYAGLRELLASHRPREMAIEQPFVALNTRSAFAIGEARAAAILAAAHENVAVFEYTPAAVKQAVTGYGRGSKDQVGEMVRLQFGLQSAPTPSDASDALAIALCHIAHRRMAGLAAGGRG
jgi:crossover junction endodeoxyribonuclease RuvC